MSHAIFLAHIRSMQKQLDGIVQRNLSHSQVRQHFLTRELTHLSLKQRLSTSTKEPKAQGYSSEVKESSPLPVANKTKDSHPVRTPTAEEYLDQADSYLQRGLESAAIGSFVRAIVAVVSNLPEDKAPSSTQSTQLNHALLSLHTLNKQVAQNVISRLDSLKPIAQRLFPTLNVKI